MNTHKWIAVDEYIKEQINAQNIPGAALAIIEGDQIVHLKGFGVSGPDGKVPTPQTPFIICSLTKSITALAVMQLVEAGKINLDAPMQRYLPWFTIADSRAAAQITVRHLLNQTSGFTIYTAQKTLVNFDSSPDATEKQARELAKFKLSRPVGSAFEYTNTNYNLLGLIIEAASGETYADYVQIHIFDPLEMRHTYTTKAAARQNGMSAGYISWFGIPVAVPDLPYPSGSLPASEIISTTEDMAHFLIAQLNGGCYSNNQIISPTSIAEMHASAVAATTAGVKMAYGMGWFIDKTGDGKSPLISHDGTAPEYKTYMALLPDQKRGMVLLMNANELLIDMAWKHSIGPAAASLLAGVPPRPIRWALVTWVRRAFLIIPIFQILDVFMTLRTIHRWRNDTSCRPGTARKWVNIVVPTISNLVLVYPALRLLTSGVLKMWLYFLGDLSWLALIIGGFAGIWTCLRTGLILRTLRKP